MKVAAIAMAATLTAMGSSASTKPLARSLARSSGDYRPATVSYQSLANPKSGDEFLFRLGIRDKARQMSNKAFGALASVLAGPAPALNFVPMGSPLVTAGGHGAADPASNTINLDPLITEAITNYRSPIHSPGYLDLIHEDAHLRQLAPVLADVAMREGGAQAFADLVTPTVAQRTRVPFTSGNYDANYADYVKQAQTRGRDWIMGGQFGRTAPPTWP